jgi:xanthine/CO dehydrogenase XdhC/CoxF family maturation factor
MNPDVRSVLEKESAAALSSGGSKVVLIPFPDGQLEALVEYIAMPLRLAIFGAGPDAVPLARISKELGWRTQVIDRRPAYIRPDRFVAADAVILAEPQDLAEKVDVDSTTAAVVMTHHFETDLSYLRELLQSPAFYIGLLGPAAKTQMLLQRLREDGFIPTEDQLSRLYSPVGLDVGAETPEEIALSIASEIQAVRSGYTGGFLKNRTGPIHFRTES